MLPYATAIGYALVIWWVSTGLILFLDSLPPRTFRYSMIGATAVLAISFYGLARCGTDVTAGGAYAAFTLSVLIWGWHEMSFFMGFVAGPRKTPCPQGCGGWKHFRHAVEACIYHELAIAATAVAIVIVTWHSENKVGLWTFLVLWAMRQSAKFNVFLGVLNLNEDFLPERLAFLGSFFRQKPMNLLFPLSVTAGTIGATVLAGRAGAASEDPFRLASLTLICTMLVLAVIEHWFLVLPLPFADLWRWMVRRGVSETAVITSQDACAHDASRPGVSVMPGFTHWSPPDGCGDVGAAIGPLARVARSLGAGVGAVRAARIDRGFGPIGATARHWADAWGK